MASDGNSVTVFGDLSKPATVLIEKISSAVGILYEPKRITRKAQAEADARKIGALADLQLNSDLERRAISRLVHQESRKQKNIEDITAEAVAALPKDAQPHELDEDWIAHFFQQCQTVSDKEMQSLWSKLLVTEASQSGSIAKRTVNCVSSLAKSDAELFTSFCQFHWFNGILLPVVFDHSEIYTAQRITFSALKHLESLGLISLESSIVLRRQPSPSAISYFGQRVMLNYPTSAADLAIGRAIFTQAGRELAPICGAQANPEYFLWVLQRWVDAGISVSSSYPREQQR